MPYILSHASFAYTLGRQLNCFTDRESLSLYMLGCLGPDIYFFDRLPPTPFIPHQKKLGNKLHDKPCNHIVKCLMADTPEVLKPFLFGFLTHIALDSTLHPYICARYDGLDHTRFEGDIDAVMYARFKSVVPFRDLFARPDNLSELNDLMHRLCVNVLGTSDPKAYQRSVRKMLRLFPVLFDPRGHRYRFLHSFEHMIGKDNALSGFILAAPRSNYPDCMNEGHHVWHARLFPEADRMDSVDEMFADAALFAQKLIFLARDNDMPALEQACLHRTMSDGPLPEQRPDQAIT